MGDHMDVDGDGIMEVDLADGTENLQEDRPRRRGSMSEEEERQRRASIKAILADNSITPTEKRLSIQHLMDGRRSSMASSIASSNTGQPDDASNPYGYADADTYTHNDSDIEEDDDEFEPVCNENTKRAEQTRPHCSHYERNCSMVAPCCGAVFGCRICHDDSPILPPLIVAKQAMGRYARSSSLPGSFTSMPQTPEETHHTIDRFAVKKVICRKCFTKQSSKT